MQPHCNPHSHQTCMYLTWNTKDCWLFSPVLDWVRVQNGVLQQREAIYKYQSALLIVHPATTVTMIAKYRQLCVELFATVTTHQRKLVRLHIESEHICVARQRRAWQRNANHKSPSHQFSIESTCSDPCTQTQRERTKKVLIAVKLQWDKSRCRSVFCQPVHICSGHKTSLTDTKDSGSIPELKHLFFFLPCSSSAFHFFFHFTHHLPKDGRFQLVISQENPLPWWRAVSSR